MDWVKGVQRAIDYMETHLMEEMKLEDIGRWREDEVSVGGQRGNDIYRTRVCVRRGW